MRRSSSSPARWPIRLLTCRKSSRSSMISPKGAPSRTARPRWSSNVRVVEKAGQAVRLGADLDGAVHLGVLQGDRHLRREQLHEVELLGRERVPDAEPLHRQDPDRAGSAAQRHDDEAAISGRVVDPVGHAEMIDARVAPLVLDVDGLVVLDHPCRDAGLTRFPRLQVRGRMDATRCQRRQEAGRRDRPPRWRRCRRR